VGTKELFYSDLKIKVTKIGLGKGFLSHNKDVFSALFRNI